MSIGRIVLRSLRQHLFSSLVTGFSIALAGGLLMAVWSIKDQAHQAFQQNDGGFDAVLGTRSSPLQLVLNAIFHLEASPGNIPWTEYERVKKLPSVRWAIPISMGDNFRGYRLVGTVPELLKDFEYAPGKRYRIAPPGRIFEAELREAVVGSFAAAKLNLKRGDKFQPYHGLNFNEEEGHEETYLVVGLLEPSNTPADRVIWIPLEGLQHMSGHTAESANELSAVLLKFKSPMTGKMLQMEYNRKGGDFTLAWPVGTVIAQLLGRLGWLDQVLRLVAYLVALVAVASVSASIYNSMNERRRQIAIFRALGARRLTVFLSVVLEAMTIAFFGMMAAFGFYFSILWIVSRVLKAETGVVLDVAALHPVMLIAPLGMIFLGGLAGIIPAAKGYRTPVAENLAPVS